MAQAARSSGSRATGRKRKRKIFLLLRVCRRPNDILGLVKKAIALVWALLAPLPAHAASLAVSVADGQGTPLEDAVVWLVAKSPGPQRPRRDAMIEQVNKTFVPTVTVVQAGTQVRFPNRDEVRHHVYSFSPAKRFEIKLYSGTPAEPILFDKPGEVVLGCNIHDHMIAYVYVVESPHFAKAGKDGKARMDDVPAGDYELHAWHYAQSAPGASPRALRVGAAENAPASIAIPLRPMTPRPATPK